MSRNVSLSIDIQTNFSRTSCKEFIFPNLDENVLQLCELADRFQIDSVRSKCEQYLQKCVEIPLAERFFFADKHSMKGLIVSIFLCQPGQTKQ